MTRSITPGSDARVPFITGVRRATTTAHRPEHGPVSRVHALIRQGPSREAPGDLREESRQETQGVRPDQNARAGNRVGAISEEDQAGRQ